MSVDSPLEKPAADGSAVNKPPPPPSSIVNNIATRIGEWAVEKGFRDSERSAQFLEDLAGRIKRNEHEGDRHFVSSELEAIADLVRRLEVGTKLMLIVTEVSEAMEALRDAPSAKDLSTHTNYGEELADVIVRVLDQAHAQDINIGESLMDKLDANDKRPHKHGRNL